jgi:ribosomal protein L29
MEERDVELESLKKELQEIRKQLLESRERSGKGQKKQPAAAKEPK